MKNAFSLLFILLFSISVYGDELKNINARDTNEVNKLTAAGFKMRLTDPEQTIKVATEALNLAKELNYNNGIAESYRVIGIGLRYKSQAEKAIESFLNALSYFKTAKNKGGMARVYNNIGTLYFDNSDYGKALDYFKLSLNIAEELKNDQLIASLALNLGNVYSHRSQYSQALTQYDRSQKLFDRLGDKKNEELLTACIQNRGVAYFHLNRPELAEKLLLEANQKAKAIDLNYVVASIDLTLSALYIDKKDFDKASKFVKEGQTYAALCGNRKLEYDFKHTSYQFELTRQNYKQALTYLQEIYRQDSLNFYNNVSAEIGMMEVKHKQEETQREAQYRQDLDRFLFWASTIVAGLLLIVIFLLTGNVKRKAKTNKRLTELNTEVSRQRDNVDRINHHLEEIIDERTKDLQVKNKKLSEYSSYLSHQIRGPIATLKGLINLEKEGLVTKEECFHMMDKCVSEIDDKIIDMSDMLHDPERTEI